MDPLVTALVIIVVVAAGVAILKIARKTIPAGALSVKPVICLWGILLDHRRNALETRRIRLREIQDEDLAILFQWRNTEKFRFLFHYDESIVTYDEFCEEFTRDADAHKFQFLIEMKDTHDPVGLTFVHSFSEKYKTCFLNLFLSEKFERRGYGTDSFVLFVLFLFKKLA